MKLELILSSVAKHISLTPEEIGFFTSLLKAKKLRRKQFFLEAGEVCDETAFVITGCLRSFTIDKAGHDHTYSFSPSGWWSADLYSWISRKPALLNIEALEESEILILSKINEPELFDRIPKFERFFRIITGNALVASQQRIIDNLSLSAADRYENFCKRYQSLANSVPARHVASYIGVTPEFFSKMKATMLRK